MKIGIIGVGWLGNALAVSLLNQGNTINGYTEKSSSTINHSNYTHHNLIHENTDFSQLEYCVFCFPPARSSEDRYAEDCISYAQSLPNSCKVVLISSTSVYSTLSGTYTENNELLNGSPRIILAEQKLRAYLGERLTILRMAGLFGPNRLIVNHMVNSGKTYSGLDPINLIHQKDAVRLIEFVLDKNIFPECINGCSSEHPSKQDFYTKLAAEKGFSQPLFTPAIESNRIISNEHSLQLGFTYTFNSPFDALTFL